MKMVNQPEDYRSGMSHEAADMIAEGSLEIVKSSAWSLICNCADLRSVMGRSSFGVQLLLLMDVGWRA